MNPEAVVTATRMTPRNHSTEPSPMVPTPHHRRASQSVHTGLARARDDPSGDRPGRHERDQPELL
jgi:hypothetical protein